MFVTKARLVKKAKKEKSFCRAVAIDSKKAKDSNYIEKAGYHNPEKGELKLNRDRIE
jgi:ribosomal protein S16